MFAHTLFTFNNTAVASEIEVPGVGGGIPIEEFLSYASSFLFAPLLYIWANKFWMGQHNPPLEQIAAKKGDPPLRFHKELVITAATLPVSCIEKLIVSV